MKRHIIIFIIVLASIAASAQELTLPDGTTFRIDRYDVSFVPIENMPDATKFLPDPPADGSFTFLADSVVYEQGKLLRQTLRGDTAVQDAQLKLEYFMKRFGEVMHKDLTPEKYPYLAYIMNGTIHDIRGSIQKAKQLYSRHRPYQHFNEQSAVPEEEEPTDYTSYPSGHSVRAWALAMLFVSLDPTYQNDIIKVGYELCQSRTIVGFHYQSDVDMAKLAASAGFARLIAEPRFNEYLQKAREELCGLSSQSRSSGCCQCRRHP